MNLRVTYLLGMMLALLFLSKAEARDYSALVVDADSGRVLYERFPSELRHPASITKIMTLYLVFEALERGELTLNTPLTVSRNAVLKPPSRLGLTPGDTLAVEDAVLALVTRSANDAATVIAENLAGSETAFAEMMTAKAHALGMRDTVFRNASGLPDPMQVTTAWDMARLGKALINDFPRYYPYFSTPRFYYRGQSFDNHNHLMETYSGMDGIKTGFINASGFNLVASAKRGGRRLIGVVFGGPSAKRRDAHMREILDDGFAQLSGAPPAFIEADFNRPAEPRAAARLADLEPGWPRVTFGSPAHFRSARATGRHARPAVTTEARGNPAHGKASAARSGPARQGSASANAPIRRAGVSRKAPTEKAHAPPAKTSKATPASCKGKQGKCGK